MSQHSLFPFLICSRPKKKNKLKNQDTASQIVEIIWPLSAMSLRSDSSTGCKGVLPLRTFIQETLRRSRTSYSTLQVALYYLIKIKPHVPHPESNTEPSSRDKPVSRAMQCGRRMFLAALILASKYLQDRNYSARAWSKISGLNTLEINQNELMFLDAVGWRLHISEATFQRWTDIVLKYTPSAAGVSFGDGHTWRTIIPRLTPDLDTLEMEQPATTPKMEFLGPNNSPSPRSAPSSFCEPATSLPSIHDQVPALRRNMLMTLEPTPRMETSSSLPSMPRPPMLPTPQLTPQTSLTSTPAASASSLGPRRPSIGAAVSQAQSMGLTRSTLDQRPPLMRTAGSFDGYPAAIRRSSLARSNSSASSPESMISDVSTTFSARSSRSSSVSSNASGSCAPQTRLAVKATLRCTNNSMREGRKQMSIASPIDESIVSGGEYHSSPESHATSQAPDFSNFTLETPVDHEAARSLCELSNTPVSRTNTNTGERQGRKRGRTGSEDQLQNQVRHLINFHDKGGWPEAARAFVIPEAAQHSAFLLSGPAGMKRACCGEEADSKVALNPTMQYTS